MENNYNVNTEIYKILKDFSISINDGMSYLLSIYFGYMPSYIPIDFHRKMLTTQIFDTNSDNVNGISFTWKVPLFEEQVTNFEWVKEFREKFKRINPERVGDLRTCIVRFKRFFAAYPQYNVKDVLQATDNYFRSLSNPKYLMKSHKFIFEGHINTGSSELLTWLEKLDIDTSNRNSKTNTMQ